MRAEFIRPLAEAIKTHFPRRTSSLEEFTTLVTQERPDSIQARAIMKQKKGISRSTRLGDRIQIGDFHYSTELRFKDKKGRPTIFVEEHGKRSGINAPLAQDRERGMWAIRTLLTAEGRLNKITEMFPDVRTDLIGMDGKRFTDEKLEALHRDANELSVASF